MDIENDNNNAHGIRIHRKKLPGYRNIEHCIKGDEVFFKVCFCRKKNKK
jgi:hypothetical protein